MSDPFKNHQPGLTSAPSDFVSITPDDSNDLETPIRTIGCTVSGEIVVVTREGNQRTIPAAFLPEGHFFMCRIKRVLATGTTATGIIGQV